MPVYPGAPKFVPEPAESAEAGHEGRPFGVSEGRIDSDDRVPLAALQAVGGADRDVCKAPAAEQPSDDVRLAVAAHDNGHVALAEHSGGRLVTVGALLG